MNIKQIQNYVAAVVELKEDELLSVEFRMVQFLLGFIAEEQEKETELSEMKDWALDEMRGRIVTLLSNLNLVDAGKDWAVELLQTVKDNRLYDVLEEGPVDPIRVVTMGLHMADALALCRMMNATAPEFRYYTIETHREVKRPGLALRA